MDRNIVSIEETLPLVSKPPVESFMNTEQANAVWPRHITHRQDFQGQIRAQQALLEAVQTTFKTLPIETTLHDGLVAGIVTERVATNLLNHLSQYLKADKAHQRIVLYLPFELTSPLVDTSAELKQANDCFQKNYRAAWESQLRQHVVRANFIDGDVLEVEKRTGDLPRVVKAAHLIPGLVRSGHMKLSEVIDYESKGVDSLLLAGIQEARAVMEKSTLTQESLPQDVSTKAVYCKLHQDVALANIVTESGATPNRLRWLRQVAQAKAVTQAAVPLSHLLEQGLALPDPKQLDHYLLCAYIEAIRLAVLDSKKFVQEWHNWLKIVRANTKDISLLDAVTKVYQHAYAVGAGNDEMVGAGHIRIPALQGPFSKNLDVFAPSVSTVQEYIKEIKQDVALSKQVYPVTILLGSQLKGYGSQSADADMAVFIKPGTDQVDSEAIATRLKNIFAHERIGGSVIMFWLDEVNGQLAMVRNTHTTDTSSLPSWTHVLMGGAWIGDNACITLLQHALLVPYLFNPTDTIDGMPVRERWLEEMERDSILYRLLHKGYERYFPVRSPWGGNIGAPIDGTSAFYDPMFRRIATELFLTRVFFPHLD